MYLKSIEIRGFKSFADKTVLDFQKGVIAIVGPNGSGKSNVSDAVRWVLGEQSVKSLRGGKMEDVIFAGTQFRKPVGLAQVVLTLDNKDHELPLDFSDITVGRRLYRSGESEYFLNNTPCRLKDIQEFFMDTGIGKEGYSIIGQGKIDAILSGKPEERRSLMEEAAGIVKYKFRKDEALKKLLSTEENVVRINDILLTYEERIEPLRLDREKAMEFLKLSEEYKEKEANYLIYCIDKVKDKRERLQVDLEKFTAEKSLYSEKKDSIKKDIADLEILQEEAENRNTSYKSEYYSNKEEYNDITSKCSILKERTINIDNSLEKAKFEIEELNKDIVNSTNVKEDLEKTGIETETKRNNLREELNFLEKDTVKISEYIKNEEYVLQNLKANELDYIKELSLLKNNIENISTGDITLKERKANIENSCKSYNSSLKINSTTIDNFNKQILGVEKEIEAIRDDIKAKSLKEKELRNKLETLDSELKTHTGTYNRSCAKVEMLKNLEKSHEGYNKPIKSIMNEIQNGRLSYALEKCFVLGEIIEVTKEFQTAVEIALGSALSNIITEDEEIAKKLIVYLKTNNLGRATFLPLSIIKGIRLEPKEIKKIHGYIGIASELIKYDNKFSPIIESVLGKTIIAKDMDSALAIAKASNYSFKIVTLDGEVVNRGGSLTGGSIYNKGSNVLGRKGEIEELNTVISKVTKDMDCIKEEEQKLKEEFKALDDKILNLKDNEHYKNIEITKLQGKVVQVQNDTKNLESNLAVATKELQIISETQNKNIQEIESKKESIDLAEERKKETLKYIESSEENIRLKKEELLKHQGKLTELKVNIGKIEENINNKWGRLKELDEDILNFKGKIKNIEENIEKLSLEKLNTIEDINTKNKQVKLLEADILKLEELFEKEEAKRAIIKTKLKSLEEQQELEIERESSLLEKLHKIELQLSKYDSEMEILYNKMEEEISLEYEEALQYKKEILEVNEYKNSIESLKNSIASLGTVNLKAISEYGELIEKYGFLKSQKDDLIKAKEDISLVIKELTEKMKVIFNENFKKLKVYFNETFVELFKGGRADLILGEGDELTSNIEINVEPPGKKLQNINLMSGGEKVLSAIALLFAILKMKPTPFCILDEIEAALDDANVNRYAEFLKKFSSTVQFIVITHRKGTMEVSNALYGVTMEEKGISKIVSVDLKEAVT